MIGALGPVMALSSWWEAKRTQRRQSEDDAAAYERALADWDAQCLAEDEAYRHEALVATPGVADWMANPLWRPPLRDPVRIGLHSAHRTHGMDSRVVSGVPCAVPSTGDIAVVGRGTEVLAIARNIRTQIAATQNAVPPDVVVCESSAEVPGHIRVVVHSRGAQAELHIDGVCTARGIRPDLLSEAEELWARRRLATYLPQTAQLSPDATDRGALWCDLGDGPWDLVEQGPHALVWGHTGRGKTVLLRRLICDLAARYCPTQVRIAVMDFKGGSTLVGLRELPHLAGELTDMDAHRLRTAFIGLLEEFREREALLAAWGSSDIRELPADVVCPRTVVIVDESAWLLEHHPDASAVLSDIAARGRSLGIHLVLCGQRITGGMPRAVLANAGLRVCVGVTDPSEASDFLPGVSPDQLGALARSERGSYLKVSVGSDPERGFVTPRGMPETNDSPAEPLWAPDIPERIDSAPTVIACAEDAPHRRLTPLTACDLDHGLVVVVGDQGSGVTSATTRMAEALMEDGQSVVCAPADPVGVLDALYAAQGEDFRGTLVIGSVTPLERVVSADARVSVTALLGQVHRTGQEVGSRVILGCRPDSPLARGIARLGVSCLVLAIAQSEAREMWRGERAAATPTPRPGRGVFRAQPVQMARPVGRDCPLVSPLPGIDQLPGTPLLVSDDGGRYDGTETWSVDQALTHRDRVERAEAGDGVVLCELLPGQMRRLLGPEQAPVLAPGEGYGWWCRAGQTRRIQLPRRVAGSTESIPSDEPTH